MRVLRDWWDKAALAVSCAVLIATWVLTTPAPERAKLALDTARMTRTLEDDLRARAGDPQPGAVPVPLARAFGPLAEPEPGEPWVYQARPRLAVSVTVAAASPGSAAPVRKVYRLERPVMGGLVAETGLVRMTWDDAPETTTRVSGYHIYRRRAGEKEFARITPDPVKEKVFTDEAVPPRQDLEYAVAAVTDEPEAIRALGLTVSGEGPRSGPKAVRTQGAFDLALRIVSRFPPDREGGEPVILARVTARKFVDGAWVEKDYSVRKGDRVGRPETINRGGRPVSVDFTTGFEILSIEPAKATRVEKVVRPTFDPKTAQKLGEEEVSVAREVPTWKLIYRDDTGTVRTLMPEEGRASSPAPPKAEKAKTVR